MNLRIVEQYLTEFGKLVKENNTMIIPTDLSDNPSILATSTLVIQNTAKYVGKTK